MTKISNQYSLTNVLTADVVNGRVGIGTASPSYPLEVKSTGVNSTIWGYNIAQFADAQTNNNGLRIGTSVGTSGLTNLIAATANDASQFGFWTFSGSAWGERMRITSAGNVGIGNTAPVNQLDLNRTGAPTLFDAGFNAVQNSGEIEMRYVAAGQAGGRTGSHIFYTGTAVGGSERMRIHSSGVVSIGNTNNGPFRLDITGEVISRGANVAAYSYEDRFTPSTINTIYANAGFTFFYSGSNRAQINMSNGVYTALSDINKKKDFEQSSIGLNEVLQLKPTLYRLKESEELSPKELGFIAQEVKELIPQAYSETGEGDDKFIGLNQMPLIAALTKAIQQQQNQINELKALINA